MNDAFACVGLIGRWRSSEAAGSLIELAAFLQERGLRVLIEEGEHAGDAVQGLQRVEISQIAEQADLAIVLGGDGTMLGAARALACRQVPLVGINAGRLGFITDIGLDAWRPALTSILEGRYASEERTLLTTRVVRQGETVWSELALNDVVVSRSSRAGMIGLQVHVDNLYMYNQRADGLIIATPTGSTAYALSASGPILHPCVQGIVLVPVAPQSLSNRPIVLPDDVTITVRVIEGREPRVAGDMQVFNDLHTDDDIIVQRAPFRTRFLHPPDYSYFATLRGKLNWHEMPSLRHPGAQV